MHLNVLVFRIFHSLEFQHTRISGAGRSAYGFGDSRLSREESAVGLGLNPRGGFKFFIPRGLRSLV